MAKKKDYNTFESDGKTYTVIERVREDSDVRMVAYPIQMYVEEVDNGEICRDPLIQRTDDQWARKQKSKLIEAILHNRPIGTIALAKGRAESKSYAITSLVDGLQRTTAIVDFKHDEFSLDKRAKPVLCRCSDQDGNEVKIEYEIAGKKYSQLPDAIKKFFDKYTLTTYMHEGFTDEELDDIVYCMNNGKTPNSYQKIRFLLGSDNMRLLQPICDSLLWEDVKGCKAKNDSILCLIIRVLMMMTHYNYTNLGSASMTKFADIDFEDYVTTKTIKTLSNLVDTLYEIKCQLTEEEMARFDSVTLPHYILNLDKFNSMENPNGVEYIDILRAFWNSESYHDFADSCEGNGSGASMYSADSIEDRQYAIDDFLDEYLDVADNNDGGFACENDNDERELEESAESDFAGTDETEIRIFQAPDELRDVSETGGCSGQASADRQQDEEGTDDLSGYEPNPETA